MADNSSILSDFGINILEEEIDDVIFQTNEFLCDATFTGSNGPFWWVVQMCMALAALFSIVVAANMAYKMMVKHEPLDVMKLFKPLVISIILLVVPTCRYRHDEQWQQLVRVGLFELHPQLHRQLYP